MRREKCTKIKNLIRRVNRNNTGIFERNPELIVVLPDPIATIIGDCSIYLSEFIIAKIKGKIENQIGHPEIDDEIFMKIPVSLSRPERILQDIRSSRKYLFINIKPTHEIVIEVFRKESGKTEINTVHLISTHKLKQLELRFPVVYSSGGTP